MIRYSAAILLFGLASSTFAQSIPEQCAVILDDARTSKKSFDVSNYYGSQREDFCSLKKSEVTSAKGKSLGLELGVFELFDFGASGASESSNLAKNAENFCKLTESQESSGFLSQKIVDEMSDKALSVVKHCIETLAGIGKRDYFLVYPQGSSGSNFSISFAKYPSGPGEVLELESLSPSNVICKYAGKEISFPLTMRSYAGTLDCTTNRTGEIQVALDTSFGPMPITKVFGEENLYENMKIAVESFHSPFDRSSWGLLEIKLFDRKGEEIEIDRVDVSSCATPSPGCGHSEAENLIDGDVKQGRNEPGLYWHPKNDPASDLETWVTVHFEKSSVHAVELHHWYKNGCMRDCSDESKVSGLAKLRANVRSASISFDGGREETWARFADSDTTRASVPRFVASN